MHTKLDLIRDIKTSGIKGTDTLLVHSSMKALGDVEGGAETVLDAFIEYMADGLLVFPTHTWDRINAENPVFDPLKEPSCVGILSNLFMKRKGVIRSLHPTHSVAAIGRDAASFTSGDEKCPTPCARNSAWGKLYDRRAKILFLGCSTKRNTFIHGVEEWYNIPERLSKEAEPLKVRTPEGELIDSPQHFHKAPVDDISQNYDKIQPAMLFRGITTLISIADARSYLCDAVPMADLTGSFLQRDKDLFIDKDPIPEEWYK